MLGFGILYVYLRQCQFILRDSTLLSLLNASTRPVQITGAVEKLILNGINLTRV